MNSNPPSDSGSRTRSLPMHSNGSATSLRPRGKRLLSGVDESTTDFPPPTNSFPSIASTPFESPFHSRAPSPIPSQHPSRSNSAVPSRKNTLGTNPSHHGDQLGNELAASLSGLWGKSWTSLQGLASNVLGSDASQELIKDKSPQRQRRPLEATHSSTQWGPKGRDESQPGAGSKEERREQVRARKRQELLMSAGALTPDAARYKRRTSDDFESASAPPGEHDDRDALVYVHHVKSEDTLAGLSIRFNCQLAVLKKANRMWSNDAIQTRKIIVVAVDACGVKGRPVSSPTPEEDLLAGDGSTDNIPTPTVAQSGFPDVGRATSSSTSRPSNINTQSSNQRSEPQARNGYSPSMTSSKGCPDEPPWKHDSWVHLDGHSSPIELARISRTNLGFFPRARRKSVSYSDLDTPSASFEMPRPSITISETSPVSPHSAHRKRGSSGSSKWAQHIMNKPGGVGKLHGKGPSAPGPSAGLDQVITKRLPSLVPPSQPPTEDDEAEFGTSPAARSLENVGGAIEGWVRKIAKSAAKAVEAQPSATQGQRDLGFRHGSDDIIEMSNAFEIGEDDLDDEDRIEEQRRGRTLLGRESTSSFTRDKYDGGSKRKGD